MKMKERVSMQIQRTAQVVVTLIQRSQKFELFSCLKSNFSPIYQLQQIYYYFCYTLNKVSKVIFSFLPDKEENQMDRR